MVGIDRDTGKIIGGWAHTAKSLACLFTTMISSRVMRRSYGSAVPALLGRSISPQLVLRYKTAIIVACELWEPRFKVVMVQTLPIDQNTPERLRAGLLALESIGEHRPRAHLGDNTPAETRSFVIGVGGNGLIFN